MIAGYADRFLRAPHEPAAEDTVFWTIAYPAPAIDFRYFTVDSDSGSVLLVFTSPFRAWYYGMHDDDVRRPFVSVGWSVDTCAARLSSAGAVARRFALDAGPGCDPLEPFDSRASATTRRLAGLWLAQRTAEDDQAHRLYGKALAAARSGRFRSALEPVGRLLRCTLPEEPRLHVLSGACGIALADEEMTRSAIRALQWLDPEISGEMAREAEGASGDSPRDRLERAQRVVRLVEKVRAPLLFR